MNGDTLPGEELCGSRFLSDMATNTSGATTITLSRHMATSMPPSLPTPVDMWSYNRGKWLALHKRRVKNKLARQARKANRR